MPVRKVLLYPDNRLYQVSATVEAVDNITQEELLDMEKTVRHYEGYALAAVQVGIMKRMFVADNRALVLGMKRYEHDLTGWDLEKKTWHIVNPEIIEISKEEVTVQDACLSLPGIAMEASRPAYVKIRSLDYNGEEQIIEAHGLISFCFQHEIDHLDGKLFYDRLSHLKKKMLIKRMEKYIANHEVEE